MAGKEPPKRKCSHCNKRHQAPTGKHCTNVDTSAIVDNKSELDNKLEKMNELLTNLTSRIDKIENDDTTPSKKDIPDTLKRKRQYEKSSESTFTDSDVTPEVTTKSKLRLQQRMVEDSSDDYSPSYTTAKKRRRDGKKKFKIDWPHHYIMSTKGEVEYASLSLAQFAQGYSHIIMNATAANRKVMLKYFSCLMEDATRYRWELIRGFHKIVGTMVEQGRITWSNEAEILNLRRIHIWNAPNSAFRQSTNKPTPVATTGSCIPCSAYQSVSCQHQTSHNGQDHVCAYCYKLTGRTLPHPEAVCRRKQYNTQPQPAKNEGMREH